MKHREEIQKIKSTFRVGLKIRLVRMDDPQAPPIGTQGTVLGVDDSGAILVAWDTGSSLSVILGIDEIEVLSDSL